MSTTVDSFAQYLSLTSSLNDMLIQAGVESQHTSAAVLHVTQVATGALTVGQSLYQAHSNGGPGLLGAVLLGLQMFVPHTLPQGIQITFNPPIQ